MSSFFSASVNSFHIFSKVTLGPSFLEIQEKFPEISNLIVHETAQNEREVFRFSTQFLQVHQTFQKLRDIFKRSRAQKFNKSSEFMKRFISTEKFLKLFWNTGRSWNLPKVREFLVFQWFDKTSTTLSEALPGISQKFPGSNPEVQIVHKTLRKMCKVQGQSRKFGFSQRFPVAKNGKAEALLWSEIFFLKIWWISEIFKNHSRRAKIIQDSSKRFRRHF